MLSRRRRLADVVSRQLDLFARENAALLRSAEAALAGYDAAGRDDATEPYARYDELLEEASDALGELRDSYAATLPADRAEAYAASFARAAARRFPALAPSLPED